MIGPSSAVGDGGGEVVRVLKVFVVILIGIAVGVTIELVLAQRQRARRVVLDEPDLPPGARFDLDGDAPTRRRRASAAPMSSIVFDDEDGGFRILGPVQYDDARHATGDRSGRGGVPQPGRASGADDGSGGSDLGQ